MRSTRVPGDDLARRGSAAIEASASATACEPPRATGQPTAWPGEHEHERDRRGRRAASRRQHRVRGVARRTARARAVPSKRVARAPAAERSAAAGRSATARADGAVGRSGPRIAGSSLSASRTSGSISLRYASPSAPPIDAAVAVDRAVERHRGAVVERVRERAARAGRARARARPAAARAGTARPAGAGGPPSRCRGRSRAASARPSATPPPIVSAASSTSTERPARARAIAAASPFGPAPTTTASGKQPPHAAHRGAERVERRADRRRVPDVAPLATTGGCLSTQTTCVSTSASCSPNSAASGAQRVLPEAVLLLVAAHASGPSRRSGPRRASAPAPGRPSRRRPRSR